MHHAFGVRRLVLLDFGRVDVCGESCITTEFVHVCGVPIVPLRSQIVIAPSSGPARRVSIPLQPRSIALGYLRAWSLVVVVGLGLAVALGMGPSTGQRALLAAAAVMLACAVSVWLLAAPTDRTLLLRAYERSGGMAVDVGLLSAAAAGGARAREGDAVEQQALASLRGSAPGLYREHDGRLDALALHDDAAVLEAALTLTRIAWGRARGAERDRLDALHDRIWSRLRQLVGD